MPEGGAEIDLSRKLVDGDGRLIAAVSAEIDGWGAADIDAVWVEEPYRKQGFGSYLIGEVVRAAKENGAYVLLTQAGDWNVGFFRKNGFTARGELEDYPRGHRSYELEMRL